MKITVKESVPSGRVCAPPSKSFAHRALILGAFSEKSIIKNIAFSDDVSATVSCLERLGAEVKRGEDFVEIGGLRTENIKENTELFCNESGSTLRFLIPICLLSGKKITLAGTKKLISRPLFEYEKICRKSGFLFEKTENSVTVCGNLKIGCYSLNGDVSSQYITGFLLALCLLNGESKLIFNAETQSRPYIDITLDTMRDFGIKVCENRNEITVFGGKPKSREYIVEGDASNAAYIEAFDFLGDVSVDGLNRKTVQGDIVYKQFFDELKNGKKNFDLKNFPDLAPVMFSACCLAGGGKFIGIKRLRFKESDRLQTMAEELKKFGVTVDYDENSATVNAENISAPEMTLCSHNDHRIVMALTVLAAKFGGEIEGAQAVEKSFPDFFEKCREIGIKITENA